MRFLSRAAIGLVLALVTVALIAAGAWRLMDARSGQEQRGPRTKT